MKLTWVFLALTLLLCGIGMFILYESSSYNALLQLHDRFFFIKYQLLWTCLGVGLCIFISKINYKIFYNLALPFLIVTVILLFAVFLPGIGLSLKGAHRWIDLGFFVIQPSELLKITLTLYLAAWLSVKEKGRLIAFLMLFGFCVLLVLLQPDMGTSSIIAATALIMYFLAGSPLKEFVILAAVLIIGAILAIFIAPYRLQRLTHFQGSGDLSKTSYHVKQILISLGSGGVAGVGLGNSTQKYAYLPESTTDSIFAIYAEETGFIGSFLLIGLFLTYLCVGFLIAMSAQDMFGKLLASGIMIFMTLQVFINISSQSVLIPLTGVPLPFMSYGGSSMIINFISVGIILAVGRKDVISHKIRKRV